MRRYATQDEQVREHIDHVRRLELARYPDRQALAGELVDDVQQADLTPVMRTRLDEVVGPDMIAVLGPQPDTGAIPVPQPALSGDTTN